MNIIAHRGLFNDNSEGNSVKAFQEAISAGFGIEIDIRDSMSEIVIAHDLPIGGESLFSDVLKIPSIHDICIAINIKSDGMGRKIFDLLELYSIKNYFIFDMSGPESYKLSQMGLKIFSRWSCYEEPSFLSISQGVWVDCFNEIYMTDLKIRELLDHKKELCFVSPELHGYSPYEYWHLIKKYSKRNSIAICTDIPFEANNFFNL